MSKELCKTSDLPEILSGKHPTLKAYIVYPPTSVDVRMGKGDTATMTMKFKVSGVKTLSDLTSGALMLVQVVERKPET